MAVIAVGSVHGSPGATTLALEIAQRCGAALLVEADPDGGCIAARLDLALRPGLTELAGAARGGIAADDLWRFAQPFASGAVIVAHPAAEQVHAALRAAVHHVSSALPLLGVDAVIDVGRLRPGSPALGFAALADRTVVIVENSVEGVVAIRHRAQLLAGVGRPLVVLASAKPYGAPEVADACGQAVWGVVPRGLGRRSRRRRAAALSRLVSDLTAEPAILAMDDVPARPHATGAAGPGLERGPTTDTVAVSA